MIKTMKEGPQTRRDGALWSKFMKEVGLHLHELDDGIAAKAAPVEHERGIMHRRGVHRHGDLVPT